MKNTAFILLGLLLFGIQAKAEFEYNFDSLDHYLNLAPNYIAEKTQDLEKIKTELINTPTSNLEKKYALVRTLVNRYELLKYDSANFYANQLQELAFELNHANKIAYSRYKMGLVLGAKGLFKEATDTLSLVKSTVLNHQQKIDYYRCMIKTYFDLEHFVDDSHYSPIYKSIALNYCDSVINIEPEDSHSRIVHVGLKKMATGKFNQAIPLYLEVLNNHEISMHYRAMYNATLGFIYKMKGELHSSVHYFSEAAIADIKSGVKETTALRGLAETLFELKDIDHAYKYILVAAEDASYYGTHHRVLEFSSILSTIEKAYAENLSKSRKRIIWSAVAVSGLSIIAIISLLFSILQLSKLKKAKLTIEESNRALSIVNQQLKEANRIKEDYIGYYFNLSAEYIDQLEQIKKTINRQLLANATQSIEKTISEIKPKQERKELYTNFDSIFLSIFPNYVKKYNQLFKEEDRVKDKDFQLTTPQRIFALMKIGITDNDKIAKILNFSVNTIYTYKTKAKNQSTVSNSDFEKIIMEIRPY